MALLRIFLCSFSLLTFSAGPIKSTSNNLIQIIDLTKIDWLIEDNESAYKFKTKLPKDVYLGLYENRLIPDPYFEFNDVKFRNVSKLNWTFTGKFGMSRDDQNSGQSNFSCHLLIADQVDTVSEIYLNQKLIGTTGNMFRLYYFDIKSDLYVAENLIEVKFQSPVNYSNEEANSHKRKYGYQIPPDCPLYIQQGECHVNMIRKMQASFSWDWGPAFPTVGLGGQFQIESFNTCKILQFSVVPILNPDQKWNLNIDFVLYCYKNFTNASFSILIEKLNLRINFTQDVQKGRVTVRHTEKIKNTKIDIWYPNGYGNQSLYEVTGISNIENEQDQKSIKVGFRTVELIQDKIQNFTEGLTFYFKINNQKIFLKGSNWIPGDSFLSRLTKEKLEFYFKSMKEANFNAIRVWGGGIYETDTFHELADKYGIMIWQDMMFAVSLYPGNEDFLANVRMEIVDQVNRLKHHPSIIVWAGNNENELGLAGGWFSMDTDPKTYRKDYLALYWSTIYEVINETDYYSRPYLLSSPSNGAHTVSSGGIDTNPSNPLYGDMHVYEYIKDGWDYKTYPIPRCVTEFGLQSLPSIDTWYKAVEPGHMTFSGTSVIHRQRHTGGQLEMLQQILQHFHVPACEKRKNYKRRPRSHEETVYADGQTYICKTIKSSVGYFEEIIYLTQINQAMGYKTEVEHYRRWMSFVNAGGEGLSMCALYWQLNDIWPGISWSSIDYGMKWKMSHYYAKNFFAPLLASPVIIDEKQLEVVIINDNQETYYNVTLVIDVHLWNTFTPIYTHTVNLDPILPSKASKALKKSIKNLVPGQNPENLSLFFNVYLKKGSTNLTPDNVHFPLGTFKKSETGPFGEVRIANVSRDIERNTFEITLNATNPAPFVWLNAKNVLGWFSDNGFTMMKERMQISFTPWSSQIKVEDFAKSLTVISLGDVYKRVK